MARNRALALAGRDLLAAALEPEGGGAGAGDEMLGAMAGLTMPADGPLGGPAQIELASPLDTDSLQARIYELFRIEVPIVAWPVPAAEDPGPPTRMIRISTALHNDLDDVGRLAEALTILARD
jgi:hypothetical protein